ncbi:MAG: c-type cytochrome [Gammaproteobacteria bacterium]
MNIRGLFVLVPVVVLGFAVSASAAGSDTAGVQKIIQSQGCTGCHTAKEKLVGPAWDWVAWRYHGKPKKASVNDVAKFIISGGTGYWKKWTGGIPMPAHSNLSMAQARAIARWVLDHPSLKPPKSGG